MSRRKKAHAQLAAENVVVFLRMHHGMTQLALANACGLSPMDISKIERKDHGIQLRKLLKLASFLSVPLDAIIHDRFDLILPTLHAAPVLDKVKRGFLKKAQAKRLDNGLRGEELVLGWERTKLAGTVYENAVDPNYALDPAFGFDLLSFTPGGQLLFIEVKATSDKDNTPFYMSANEKAFMELCLATGRNYELHRIYDLDGIPQRIIYTPKELSHFQFIPNDYLVKEI